MRRHLLSIAPLLGMALTSACATPGPLAIDTTRADYNAVLQRTGNEQLLLNLVRLRYRDTPYFLEVANLTSILSFQSSSGLGLRLEPGTTTPFNLDGRIVFEEQPTVAYVPLQGEEFAKQLLTPMGLGTVQLLTSGGWSIERILRLCVQRVNGLANAPSASGPTPRLQPDHEDFQRLASLLRELQLDGLLTVELTSVDGGVGLALRIADEALDDERTERMVELLGLAPGQRSYPLVASTGEVRTDRIAMELRSPMAMLFYAAQSVEVPEDDEDAGVVTVTMRRDGERFDWTDVLGGLIEIQSAPERPERALVAVPYRGAWFYVEDTDLSSKSTFLMLTQIFALQAGEIGGSAPFFTLPIGS